MLSGDWTNFTGPIASMKLDNRVLATMMHDATVAEAFLAVQQLLVPPSRLFYPDILWRTLRPRRRTVPESTAPSAPASVSTAVNLPA